MNVHFKLMDTKDPVLQQFQILETHAVIEPKHGSRNNLPLYNPGTNLYTMSCIVRSGLQSSNTSDKH